MATLSFHNKLTMGKVEIGIYFCIKCTAGVWIFYRNLIKLANNWDRHKSRTNLKFVHVQFTVELHISLLGMNGLCQARGQMVLWLVSM